MNDFQKLLHDPFLYLNYGSCILAIVLLEKYKKKVFDTKYPGRSLFNLICLAVILMSCLYLSKKFGDVSLDKLGIKHD